MCRTIIWRHWDVPYGFYWFSSIHFNAPEVDFVGICTVVNSHLLTCTSTQSLGDLNKVLINTVFVFKALMSAMPWTILVSLMVDSLVIDSWALRTVETYYDPNSSESSYFSSMWLVAISFLTIGYGDFDSATYCRRFVTVTTGLMGEGTAALLVAVLASKLAHTWHEKCVHNFGSRVNLDKILKKAVPDVNKHALKLWKIKRQGPMDANRRTNV